MGISIRPATIDDASSLANIIVESWKSAYSELIPKDEIARYLDKNKRKNQFEKFIQDEEIVLIALFDQIPCGLAFANKDNDEGLEECGSIYSMYLLEEYWGRGVSSELMTKVIEILERQGVKRVSLWVYEKNLRARKFYEKHNFAFDGHKKYSRFSNELLELRYIKEL